MAVDDRFADLKRKLIVRFYEISCFVKQDISAVLRIQIQQIKLSIHMEKLRMDSRHCSVMHSYIAVASAALMK